MSQYTSYYLYQKYEKRGEQDWIPCYPNTYSISGDATNPMSLVVKSENDTQCGYTPTPTEPMYRWVNLDPSTDYYCDGVAKYYKQQRQVSYDGGTTWSNLNEYQRGSQYEASSSDCGGGTTMYRWAASGETYCKDEYATQLYKKQVSYNNGSTWTDVIPIETKEESTSEKCNYRWGLTQFTSCLEEEEYKPDLYPFKVKFIKGENEYIIPCDGNDVLTIRELKSYISDENYNDFFGKEDNFYYCDKMIIGDCVKTLNSSDGQSNYNVWLCGSEIILSRHIENIIDWKFDANSGNGRFAFHMDYILFPNTIKNFRNNYFEGVNNVEFEKGFMKRHFLSLYTDGYKPIVPYYAPNFYINDPLWYTIPSLRSIFGWYKTTEGGGLARRPRLYVTSEEYIYYMSYRIDGYDGNNDVNPVGEVKDYSSSRGALIEYEDGTNETLGVNRYGVLNTRQSYSKTPTAITIYGDAKIVEGFSIEMEYLKRIRIEEGVKHIRDSFNETASYVKWDLKITLPSSILVVQGSFNGIQFNNTSISWEDNTIQEINGSFIYESNLEEECTPIEKINIPRTRIIVGSFDIGFIYSSPYRHSEKLIDKYEYLEGLEYLFMNYEYYRNNYASITLPSTLRYINIRPSLYCEEFVIPNNVEYLNIRANAWSQTYSSPKVINNFVIGKNIGKIGCDNNNDNSYSIIYLTDKNNIPSFGTYNSYGNVLAIYVPENLYDSYYNILPNNLLKKL